MEAMDGKRLKYINYGSMASHVFLWQKAICLVPIWAVLLIPVLGIVCRVAAGNMGMQVGFGITVSLLLLYLFEDILKRKIGMDAQHIYHGFKTIPIKEISNAEVVYKPGRLLPSALSLRCNSGRQMRFNLAALSGSDTEFLLKHLQSNNSCLQTASALNTLVKCRFKPLLSPERERLQLRYCSSQPLTDSIATFKFSAQKWVRVGPIVTSFIFSLFWMNSSKDMFMSSQPTGIKEQCPLNLWFLHDQVCSAIGLLFSTSIGSLFSRTDATSAYTSVLSLWFIGPALLLAYLAYVVNLLLQPNLLVADKNGVRLARGLGEWSLPRGSINWTDVDEVKLLKDRKGSGQLRLTAGKISRKLVIDLSNLTMEDRSLLCKRLQSQLPAISFDHEVVQVMTPESDRSYTEIWLQSLTQSPERKTLDPLMPGQIVGEHRFEILRNVGVGGQGKAYLSRRTCESGAPLVVLKETIIPVFADRSVREKALQSFHDEALLLKSLSHSGIVQLVDFFVEDHRAYLVLEHIDGANLRELVLAKGPLTEEQTLDLAIQMSDITNRLNSYGVVHRDFTPDNLILDSAGRLKLIDFNVAQQILSGSSGTIVGKRAYLAPEQFRGKACHQSDIYSLGCTLHFLLTGCDPEPISQSSPGNENPEISVGLNRVVLKATALPLNQRYQSSNELQQDLLKLQPEALLNMRRIANG